MHQASMKLMQYFVGKYVKQPCSVADIGSYNVNGTFKDLFKNCAYEGLDIAAGPNVDRVVSPYAFGGTKYDVVVSGSTMEHVEDLREWSKEIIRICNPGGLICIVAPHQWGEHRHPVDCWRILPDGMRWLFKDLEILECRMDVTDTLLIARKRKG